MGLGKNMALKLAKMGCMLSLADVNDEACKKVEQEI